MAPEAPALLAVDLGLRSGLALYGSDGRLRWYRSQNFGNQARLKRAVPSVLHGAGALAWLVLEGGGPVADVWEREAARRALPVLRVAAEDWRERLLYAREQRSGPQAKDAADGLARPAGGQPRPLRPGCSRRGDGRGRGCAGPGSRRDRDRQRA